MTPSSDDNFHRLDLHFDPFVHPYQKLSQHSMTDNIIDRDQLQDAMINQILDDMDIKTMMAILYDNMSESYDKYSVDELIEEVKEYYPHLLEESVIN